MQALKTILLLLTIIGSAHISFSQTTDAVAQRIKHFYTFYIIEEEGMPDKKKINDTLNHYCTAAFLKKIRNEKDVEADPILNVQDFDKQWVNTLTVTKVEEKSNKYKVCFFETYSKEDHCVTVSLKEEAGVWKIDRITY